MDPAHGFEPSDKATLARVRRYRDRAEECRALAAMMTFSTAARDSLLITAASYERMADAVAAAVA